MIDVYERGLDSYNLTATIAYELVHAVTDEDGSSLEETFATSVRNRIARKAAGTLKPRQSKLLTTRKFMPTNESL